MSEQDPLEEQLASNLILELLAETQRPLLVPSFTARDEQLLTHCGYEIKLCELGQIPKPDPTSEPTPTTALTKYSLMTHLANELDLPHWFGHNWDALEECLIEILDADGKRIIVFRTVDALKAIASSLHENLLAVCGGASHAQNENAIVIASQ